MPDVEEVGHIHVMGAPQRDIRGDLDARTCDQEDLGELVVFHPRSRNLEADVWECVSCGESNAGVLH